MNMTAALASRNFLHRQGDSGAQVLLADPGRTYAPSARLQLLATYAIPTLQDLESVPEKRTLVWRIHTLT